MRIIHTQQKKAPDDVLFFDIETTGLSWRTSHVYLIGCSHAEPDGGRVLTQWFLENPAQERDLLLSFSDFLAKQLEADPSRLLVHYNGATFDLPYLRHKLQFYGLPDPFDIPSFDLYAALRPYRALLSADGMRQRDLEVLLGIRREDKYDGGALIPVYQHYLQSADQESYDALLLHNRADIEGLAALYPLRGIPDLAEGNFSIISADHREGRYLIRIAPSEPIPVRCETEQDGISVKITENTVAITLTPETARKKQYFTPPKDYYYLPEEDTAIHKSVGTFVDRAHRRTATAETCYQWVEGRFLPLYGEAFSLPFFSEYRGLPWLRLDTDVHLSLTTADDPALRTYLTALLGSFLSASRFRSET